MTYQTNELTIWNIVDNTGTIIAQAETYHKAYRICNRYDLTQWGALYIIRDHS